MSVDVTLSCCPQPNPARDAFDLGHAHTTNSMPLLTQRYALPIQHNISYESWDVSNAGEHTPRAASTLRRKTPNGTLNAGFEASDHARPPFKFQLLPSSEAVSTGLVQPSSQHGKRTFLQHTEHQQLRHNAQLSPWHGTGAIAWQTGQFGRPISGFPVMDSMLNQGYPVQHFNPHQFYGQTVPSVVQPSLQYVGPTASGGQGTGPYGPYWHDGTFVPYRPAAVRDPRFYHHPAAHFPNSLANSQLAFPVGSWQPTLNQTPWAPLHNPNALATQIVKFSEPQLQPSVMPSYAINGHVLSYDSGYLPALRHAAPPHSRGADVLGDISHLVAEYGPSSSNGRQRDRTFSWALQQYRELLAYIHHTRRKVQQARNIHGQQPGHQRPSFYPKPPRQSSLGSLPQLPKLKTGPDILYDRADVDHSTIQSGDNVGGHSASIVAGTPEARAKSIWSPSAVHLHDNEYQRRASYDQFQRSQPRYSFVHSDQRLESTDSIGPDNDSPLPLDESPPSRATIALAHMSNLCQESDCEWTDGMHLIGCLAYGLGDYQNALRWYTKVLEKDPKHLEATSNLAATLLALGRRKEAEQCWMQVVKSAPNHFEAVEHLVGLFCNEQRGKEAIKVIEYVERSLRQPTSSTMPKTIDRQSECSSSTTSRSPCMSEQSDKIVHDFDGDGQAANMNWKDAPGSSEPGFGSSGYAIPGCDNGRILALIHAKGNMLYALGENSGAARAFEDAVLIATGRTFDSIQRLVKHILSIVSTSIRSRGAHFRAAPSSSTEPILLTPEQALATARLCFPYAGELQGLRYVAGGPQSLARKAVISTTSNSLLSLAKIFQDSMSNTYRSAGIIPLTHGVRDILALYYLSLSLQPSPSTANNVGILLASVQQGAAPMLSHQKIDIPGVIPGSGIALALQYYNYGLQLDQHHAHLYTNLGSLLKDIGQLDAAINMYERAVKCDGKFDIALANLANAVKDKGRIGDAIVYYQRAVEVSPDFAEAVCGLANALNSVCGWQARGGIAADSGKRDRWHVDNNGMLVDAKQPNASSSGWIKRVVDIVEKQLRDGEKWGSGSLSPAVLDDIVHQIMALELQHGEGKERERSLRKTLNSWAGNQWEGARVTRLIERAARRTGWQWYADMYVKKRQRPASAYSRPQLPASLAVPTAPTVLPFHTFTCPMSAKQIRQISQRNGLRISVSTLRSPWLPKQVYHPPAPPEPFLRVGYVSSDFNNHPLAHLMQSVFGLHDKNRVRAYCYATTSSDNSTHRQQIQREAPVFHDASSWSSEKTVQQIVEDGIHILINLNGYTRGARNDVFAARPAPVQMSFMGFAGTLGAEWCDYLLADQTAVPVDTLRPWRRNVDLEDQAVDANSGGDNDDWVYGENIIYCRDTFFCCDHKQSAPDAHDTDVSWDEEVERRWQMRKELFPSISDDTVIFGNLNQLYKIDPTTFRTWLRILARVPNSILWLLRFPDLGEVHLLNTARMWAGADVASRVIFTDVAPKHMHISRTRICDLVIDTAECNAHTTAADVLWSGTPLLTLPRYAYKMCSRMAASILKGALPKTEEGMQAAQDLIAVSEEDYEEKAVALGRSFGYVQGGEGVGHGRLMEMRKMLFHARWSSALFDTARWVRDLEDAYEEAWRRWVAREGGDIWLDRIPRKAA